MINSRPWKLSGNYLWDIPEKKKPFDFKGLFS
jgi:hypothetical protein